MPTPSPTPIPTWTILFSGFPCEDQECWPDPSTTSSYYAIYSDGTGLEQVAEFPLDVPVPGDHRSPGEFNVPQLSPDGSMVAYIVENQRTIDLVETATGEPYEAFGTWVNIGLNNTVFGSVCWDPGGVVLKYSVQYIGKEKETEFHVIDYDKTHAPGERPLLFTLPVGLWIWTADCSPNGLEMAFSVTNSDPEIAGLYVVNLNTGEWRKILPHYFITKIRTGTTSIAP